MFDRTRVVLLGSRRIHVILMLLTLVLGSGCGRAAYDQKLESRIQQLRSQTPAEEQPEEAATPPADGADESDAEAEDNPFDGNAADESADAAADEETVDEETGDENADAANQ